MREVENWNITVESTPQAAIEVRFIMLIFKLFRTIFLSVV
jgi:hypothetical protein